MTPERWQQVKEIFNSAIRYQPGERRKEKKQGYVHKQGEKEKHRERIPLPGSL